MTIDLDALEKLAMPGMSVWLVETAPHLPASPSFAIRKWDNDGLEGGTHHLVAEPVARAEINRLRAELKEAKEHLARCVELVPAPGAIEAADAFIARNGKGEG